MAIELGEPTPQPGGTLIVGRGADSVTLSPYASAAPDAEVIAHVAETLYELTPDGRIVPLLAESLPRMGPDGRSMTIRLRRGIRFHDGTPFDASAVKWNFDFILSPTAVQRAGGMRPPTGEPYGRQLVGTGPFRFREWVRGDRIVLERNPDYWGPRKPLLDQIVWRVIPDDGARVLALEGGQIHVAVRVPPRETTRLALNRALRIERTSSVRTIYIAFNNQKPPFTDVRVRQAFNYAVNKRAIVQTVLDGAARVSDAPISPGIVGYSPIQPGGWPYDVNRARQLLSEAGHGGGVTVTILHPTGRYVQDAAVAAAVQAQLRAAGINARLQTMEWAAYLAYTNQPPNRSETNAARRNDLYRQAMTRRDAPWIFLHSESQVTGLRREVQDLVVHLTERVLAHTAWLRR